VTTANARWLRAEKEEAGGVADEGIFPRLLHLKSSLNVRSGYSVDEGGGEVLIDGLCVLDQRETSVCVFFARVGAHR